MGYELKVVNNNGEALSLTDNEDYTVFKITGLTPPKVAINSSVNSTQDGTVISSVRMDVRNLVIYMTVNGDVEANRINLYKYFPPKKTVSIFFKNETRNVYIEGTVELIECDLFANREKAQISIICPSPYFKEVDELTTNFSEIDSYFEFPFSIEKPGIEISSIANNIRKSIIYTGDTDTGVIIELFAASGNVVKPTIYDVLKRQNITLNMTLLEGDTVRVNTNHGKKSVTLIRNGVTSNAMGYLSPDSEWLELVTGDNVFTYDCESGGANLQILFKSTILYSGV